MCVLFKLMDKFVLNCLLEVLEHSVTVAFLCYMRPLGTVCLPLCVLELWCWSVKEAFYLLTYFLSMLTMSLWKFLAAMPGIAG